MVQPVVTSRELRRYRDSEKVRNYANMTAAILRGDKEGMEISKRVGWGLDSMKVKRKKNRKNTPT